MSKVSIPNPCPKKKANLHVIEGSTNQWCTSCATEIIDFTKMSTEEILEFLNQKKGDKVCGILEESTPTYYNYWQWTKGQYKRIKNEFRGVKRFAYITALIVTFGLSSCTKKQPVVKKGKIRVQDDDSHLRKGKMVIGEMKYVDSTAIKVFLLLITLGLASCIRHHVTAGYVKVTPQEKTESKSF